jgi:phenylalanyl-tRNA synthetase beta chain
MLCSEQELGFAENSPGIMILDNNTNIGENIGKALNLFDYVIDYEITPNRGDCLSVLGIARELSAITGIPIQLPKTKADEIDEDISKYIEVEIENPELCPRYTAKFIKDISIGESPLWLKNRLIAVGLRPINNIVDITNYVMYEVGQPLHAFDYSFIENKKIVVKTAEKGLKFKTLDSKEHELYDFNLLICDGKKPVALAGIMGGENSEVLNTTKDVLLESAFFEPANIRKSAKKLGIQTEAAYRFERSIDIDNVPFAANRAAYLMSKFANGKVIKGIVDNYPLKKEKAEINLRKKRLWSFTGEDIDFNKAKDVLRNLGFNIVKDNQEEVTVKVPSFRNDIFQEVDLIEEILRIYGYNKIQGELPPSIVYPEYKYDFVRFTKELKEFIKNAGFSEAINYSFIASKDNKLFNTNNWDEVKLINPLTEDLEVLRFSILPGLLRNIRDNVNFKNENIKLFEYGKTFYKDLDRETGVGEKIEVAGVLAGDFYEPNWSYEKRKVDFFDLKGLVNSILNKYNISNVKFAYPDADKYKFLNCNKSAVILIHNEPVGFIGELNPNILEYFEIDIEPVVCFLLNVDKIFDKINFNISFKEIPKFPSVERDLALLMDVDIKCQDVFDIIKEEGRDLVEKIFIFDLYKGKGIPEHKKSVAFKIIFRDLKSTLKTEKVNKIIDRIIRKLEEKLKIQIR